MAMEAALPANVTVSGQAARDGRLVRGYYLSFCEVCDCDRLYIDDVDDHREIDPCRDGHMAQANLPTECGLPQETVIVVSPSFPASISANGVVGRRCNLCKDHW